MSRSAKAFIVFLLLVPAGCGGNEETSSLTKAQFIKRADAICKKTDEDQLESYAQLNKKATAENLDTAEQEALFLKSALDSVEAEASQIEALGAPSGDEDQVAAIVEGMETATQQARQIPQSSEVLLKIEQRFASVDKLAAEYGLKECSEAL